MAVTLAAAPAAAAAALAAAWRARFLPTWRQPSALLSVSLASLAARDLGAVGMAAAICICSSLQGTRPPLKGRPIQDSVLNRGKMVNKWR